MVTQIVIPRVIKLVLEELRGGRRDLPSNVITVTELSRCPWYTYYIYHRATPDEVINEALINGKVMHILVEKVVDKLKSLSGLDLSDLESEVVFEKQYNEYTIVGRVDLLTRDEVVEFKFTRNETKLYRLNMWYINQVQLYMWLSGKRRAKLVVIHLPTFKYNVWSIKYNEDIINERLSLIKEVEKAIMGIEPVKERRNCEFCFIRNRCVHVTLF